MNPNFADSLGEMMIDAETVDAVNRCYVSEMEKIGNALDPKDIESCYTFGKHVSEVETVLKHTYRIISFTAACCEKPSEAASLWKQMDEFCGNALRALKVLKDKFPLCGTPELYDLTLDYKQSANGKYQQNLRDSECELTPFPGLFSTKT